MSQIGSQRLANTRRQLLMLLMLARSLLWNSTGSFFGTCTVPIQDPLERNVRDTKLFGLCDDQPGDIGGKLLAVGPFLYGCFSYGASQRRGELPVAQ